MAFYLNVVSTHGGSFLIKIAGNILAVVAEIRTIYS
jgi:hypothetical protein